MNVAHCIHGLGLGGAQQVIRLLVQRGDKRHFRHYVYSCDDGLFRPAIEEAGATVRIIRRRIPRFDPWWAAALSRAMRADSIDLVHTHLFGDSLHGYLAARAAGSLPVVMTLHISGDGVTPLQRLGYRWLLSRTACNIACTKSARDFFKPLADQVGARVETILNGVDVPPPAVHRVADCTRLKSRLGFDASVRVIASVGRMAEQKGFAYLITAFATVCRSSDEDVRLVLLGDGPLREALQEQARREGIEDRVVFAGLRSDVVELLPAFDVVAFSSLYEGLSMALLEAMAAGRCIVATEVPGIIDGVTHEREAVLVPARNPARLSDALLRVLANPLLRRKLGDAAQKRFLREFTADRMVTSYENVYEDVCPSVSRNRSGEPSTPEKHPGPSRFHRQAR